MFTVKRLNHLVLHVRDAQRSMAFYRDILGFQIVEASNSQQVFMRANGSDNHHDLGLFGKGPDAAGLPEGERLGMSHMAWELESLDDLVTAREALRAAGVVAHETDHGNSLSVYALDPDGNRFEVFWMVPREEWATRPGSRQLDLEGEMARRGATPATS